MFEKNIFDGILVSFALQYTCLFYQIFFHIQRQMFIEENIIQIIGNEKAPYPLNISVMFYCFISKCSKVGRNV